MQFLSIVGRRISTSRQQVRCAAGVRHFNMLSTPAFTPMKCFFAIVGNGRFRRDCSVGVHGC